MYRAVTLYAKNNGLLTLNHLDKQSLISQLDNISIEFNQNTLWLNGIDVSNNIRSMEVSDAVSQIATISEIRAFLVAQQRKIGSSNSVVMDGRDIGTVVFPNANLKFFLTANTRIRAQRRYEDLKSHNISLTFNDVLNNINLRDNLDSNRSDSPLFQAEDAITLDATKYNVKDMLQHAVAIFNQCI